jgi:hypothetical protein
MKKILIYSMIALCTFNACKKDPKPADPIEEQKPDPNPDGATGTENIPATADIYMLGKKYLSSTEKYVLWAESKPKEPFTDYNLDDAAIQGLFIQHNSGKKTVHFFGSRLISPFKYRITYFNKKNYTTLSEQLNVPIAANFTEAFTAYVNYGKDTYILAAASSTALTDKKYYYKISSSGLPTVHDLLPDKEYKFIAVSPSGVTLSHHDIKLLWTDISIYREKNHLGDFRFQSPDYSYISPLDMTMLNDQTAIFLCSARNDQTGAIDLFTYAINLNDKKIKGYKLAVPIGFMAGTMTVKGSTIWIPGHVTDDKNASYYQFDFDNPGTKKISLETTGQAVYSTSRMHDDGTHIYVLGSENDKPCYWKDGKIVRMETGGSSNLFIHDIRN